jgi:hypothetical protein
MRKNRGQVFAADHYLMKGALLHVDRVITTCLKQFGIASPSSKNIEAGFKVQPIG